MGTIMKNALRERMRRKELYIIVLIGILLLLLCGSEAGTLSVDGEMITGFDSMFPVLHTLMNAVSCILAVVLSVRTIPNEYERQTSHLVWVRGIPQTEYHAGLALANMAGSVIAAGILYASLAVYVILKARYGYLVPMLPGFLIVCINVSTASLFTSVLSIKLPSIAAGTIGFIFTMAGILYRVLTIYKSIAGGLAGRVLQAVLWIWPDMHGIQMQAEKLIVGKGVDIHLILTGLLTVYLISLGLFFFRKKEA